MNYLIQSQQCDLAAHLTEEMNKYPKGSPERALLKAIRLGVAYGKSDSIPEEMMTRFRVVFKQEMEQCRKMSTNETSRNGLIGRWQND